MSKSYELLIAHKKALELMAKNQALDHILHSIVHIIERFSPGAKAALYFVQDQKLHLGAAPSFPEAFTTAVNGCPTGPQNGVCGTAGFIGERVISRDVAHDEVWGGFRDFVLSFGIKAAFSTPVVINGDIIATVSLYYNDIYDPTPWDFEIVEVAAHLMSIAVERKNQESLIAEQRLKLVTSSKLAALGEMAANLAHEINNPLAIIQGHVTLLKLLSQKEMLTSELTLKSMEDMEKTITRMASIIKGLKVISKDSANDPFQVSSLSTIIEDTLSYCQERFRKNGVTLTIVPFKQDILIECRPVQLSQALLNLLNNAFDAIRGSESPWVRIELLQDEKNCILSVIDSGKGISPEIKNKIMDPFFTTKGLAMGTGLGLSISRKIVEAHNGFLMINDESLNTRFDIKLPVGVMA